MLDAALLLLATTAGTMLIICGPFAVVALLARRTPGGFHDD